MKYMEIILPPIGTLILCAILLAVITLALGIMWYREDK